MFQQGHTRQKMPNKLLELVKLRKKVPNFISQSLKHYSLSSDICSYLNHFYAQVQKKKKKKKIHPEPPKNLIKLFKTF